MTLQMVNLVTVHSKQLDKTNQGGLSISVVGCHSSVNGGPRIVKPHMFVPCQHDHISNWERPFHYI